MKESGKASTDKTEVAINLQTLIAAIGTKPGCGMKHLFNIFIKGKNGRTLKDVRDVRDTLLVQRYITCSNYQHFLTDKGEVVYAHLPEASETEQLQQEPAMA